MPQLRKPQPIFLPIQEIKKKVPDQEFNSKPGLVPFAIVSRKGKKTNIGKIELPADSQIVIKTRERIEEEAKARNEVKQ
jgi:hypothetical protein